jgi:hypothetical protein
VQESLADEKCSSKQALPKKNKSVAKVQTIVTDLWKNNWILHHNDMPCNTIKI